MNKFVISYISFFDNELKSEIVEAESLLEATRLAYYKLTETIHPSESIDLIKHDAFDCDAAINAIEVG